MTADNPTVNEAQVLDEFMHELDSMGQVWALFDNFTGWLVSSVVDGVETALFWSDVTRIEMYHAGNPASNIRSLPADTWKNHLLLALHTDNVNAGLNWDHDVEVVFKPESIKGRYNLG